MGWVHYLNKAPSRAALLRGETPRWVANSPRGAYIARVILSAPPWLDVQEILTLHREAQRLSAETGVAHVLDHDVPLSSPHVCGLSVPWNIKITTWLENSRKSNRFPDPNQLSLPL